MGVCVCVCVHARTHVCVDRQTGRFLGIGSFNCGRLAGWRSREELQFRSDMSFAGRILEVMLCSIMTFR